MQKISKFFCSLCGQGFTRHSSGNRHNENIHNWEGEIVLFIEYIIGRITGRYQPANPSKHRKEVRNNYTLKRNSVTSKKNYITKNSNDKFQKFIQTGKRINPNIQLSHIDNKLNDLIDYTMDLCPAESILKICYNIKLTQNLLGEDYALNLIDQVIQKADKTKFNEKINKLKNMCDISKKNDYSMVTIPQFKLVESDLKIFKDFFDLTR